MMCILIGVAGIYCVYFVYSLNSLTFYESINLITRPIFMTFIALTVLAHFAFMPEEETAIT